MTEPSPMPWRVKVTRVPGKNLTSYSIVAADGTVVATLKGPLKVENGAFIIQSIYKE